MIKYDIYREKNSNEKIFFRNGFYLYLFKLKKYMYNKIY